MSSNYELSKTDPAPYDRPDDVMSGFLSIERSASLCLTEAGQERVRVLVARAVTALTAERDNGTPAAPVVKHSYAALIREFSQDTMLSPVKWTTENPKVMVDREKQP